MKPLMKYHVTIDVTDGRKIKTWGVFPIQNCKILDGIYNPESKDLSILIDSVTERYTEFPVETKNGKVDVQYRKLDQYYRLKIAEQDIPFFLESYVENNFEIEPEVESNLIIEG